MAYEKTDVLREIASVREFLIKLSKGIDPTCDLAFESDTILNNRTIQTKLRQADSLLNRYYVLIEDDKTAALTARTRGTVKFMLPQNAVQGYSYSNEPIAISSLVYSLNEKYKKEGMCNLRATTLTRWLEEEGYLRAVELDSGRLNRIPTNKGESIGITCVEKSNNRGERYFVCMYNVNAQKLLLEHLANQ